MPRIALFGRYWAADSPIHALDPRTKLLGVLAFMVVALCTGTYPALGICVLFTIIAFALAGIPAKQALKSIGPLMFIVVITALLNIFFVQGGAIYADWGWGRISQAGVHAAVFLSIRLTLLLLMASLLTLTTTTLDITDAFERLLGPFHRIGFPAHEFAMLMGIALRFLPQFVTESATIRAAQVSRGSRVAEHPFRNGMQGLTSLIVPLFTSAFRHAETLSSGMEARCYHGATGRTHLSPLQFSKVDGWAVIALAALLACVVLANVLL